MLKLKVVKMGPFSLFSEGKEKGADGKWELAGCSAVSGLLFLPLFFSQFCRFQLSPFLTMLPQCPEREREREGIFCTLRVCFPSSIFPVFSHHVA